MTPGLACPQCRRPRELLLLAVDVQPRPTSLEDPLLLGARYTERLFEPEPG